ncbi:ABC transporter permease [Thermoclostridium stercorarium]|uniref:ABC transporter permease n=1 Tax=Thermoclostridium stercorarium TaxID=1510 RepID=UPI001FA79B97|nr:ABC transporter permease [Thermoclostridium stercorarium]
MSSSAVELNSATISLITDLTWAFTVTGKSISRNAGNVGWEALISIVASMNGLFLPVLTSVCVSRIWDMEHKGNTLKMLLTLPVRQNRLYAAKYVSVFIIMAAVCMVQVIAVAIFGLTNSFARPVPVFLLSGFLTGTVMVSMTVIALQQWLSMAVKNQAFALAFGMIGGFLGVVADLFPEKVRKIFIWSYYTGLCPVTQVYMNGSVWFTVRDHGSLLSSAARLIIVGIVFYFAGSIHVSKQEI